MSDLPADTLTTTIADVMRAHGLVTVEPSPLVADLAAAVVSVLATHNEQEQA